MMSQKIFPKTKCLRTLCGSGVVGFALSECAW